MFDADRRNKPPIPELLDDEPPSHLRVLGLDEQGVVDRGEEDLGSVEHEPPGDSVDDEAAFGALEEVSEAAVVLGLDLLDDLVHGWELGGKLCAEPGSLRVAREEHVLEEKLLEIGPLFRWYVPPLEKVLVEFSVLDEGQVFCQVRLVNVPL